MIENISSMLNIATSSKMDFYWIGTSLGGKQEIDFITYPQRITNQYGTRMQMNQQVRLYADGGTEIKAALQGNFNCRRTVSGPPSRVISKLSRRLHRSDTMTPECFS